MLHIDITDLISFFAKNRNATGIQRVASQVSLEILNVLKPEEVSLCCYSAYSEGYSIFTEKPNIVVTGHFDSSNYLRRKPLSFVELLSQRGWLRGSMRFAESKLKSTIRGRPPCLPQAKFQNGDILLVPGLPILSPHHLEEISRLRRRGLRVVQTIFDIIPVRKPSYFADDLPKKFSSFIRKSTDYASHYITISEYVKEDLSNFLSDLNIGKPITAVPLAHEFKMKEPADHVGSDIVPKYFVLAVGTLEIRKNYLRLCRVWQRLHATLGDATPKLVLVGKIGWLIDDLIDFLEKTKNVSGSVLILEKVSDGELMKLYQSASFCVAASTDEGWGLPIGEAAWFGRPTIISRGTSFSEVLGRGICDEFNPYDEEEIYEMALSYVKGPALQEALLRLSAVKLRTWADVGADYIEVLSSEGLSR